MAQLHRQNLKNIIGLLDLNHVFKGHIEGEATELRFDLDLPGTNDTEIQLVIRGFGRERDTSCPFGWI
jgi:hypothetical protein